MCHRTVRWASGATAPCAPTIDCAECTVMNSVAQKSELQSQRSPDCPDQRDNKALQRSTAPNPNGCADVACTGQCTLIVQWRTRLSGAPIASRNQPTVRSGWEAINTPTNSFTPIQAFWNLHSLEEQKPNTPRHNQSNQSTQSPQNQL
jgi:hypothetical protein